VKKETEEKEVVKSASQNSVEEIVKRLAALKLEIVKNIDSLEEKLISEYRRFVELQQTIDVQAKSLEEIYGILEARIKEQEEQIRQLTQKADDSVAQVQKIAVKAIEGASSQRMFVERSKENG
jgi:hypothetical protein